MCTLTRDMNAPAPSCATPAQSSDTSQHILAQYSNHHDPHFYLQSLTSFAEFYATRSGQLVMGTNDNSGKSAVILMEIKKYSKLAKYYLSHSVIYANHSLKNDDAVRKYVDKCTVFSEKIVEYIEFVNKCHIQNTNWSFIRDL